MYDLLFDQIPEPLDNIPHDPNGPILLDPPLPLNHRLQIPLVTKLRHNTYTLTRLLHIPHLQHISMVNFPQKLYFVSDEHPNPVVPDCGLVDDFDGDGLLWVNEYGTGRDVNSFVDFRSHPLTQ